MRVCPQCKLKYPSDKSACFVDGSTLVDIQDPRIGTTIVGRYTLEEVVGEGGMATVYRASDRVNDRPCAIKVMNPELAQNPVIQERFRREAKAAQKIAHPNIIEILDQGETADGAMYLVMELLEGQTLAELMDHGKVPIAHTLAILIQVARALARAHDLEVIHRDMKPENIFLAHQPDGTEVVKLLDFGIARSMQDARLTGSGEVFGTPQYMAPERIMSTEAGPAADLYALGVMLFEMLTGKLPFSASDAATFFVKHLKEPPPSLRGVDPSLPEALDRLCLELMAKSPAERPVDAHRVYGDLMAVAEPLGIEVPREPQAPAPSSRQPSITNEVSPSGRWDRRARVFSQMLARAYPKDRPNELAQLLSGVQSKVAELTKLEGETGKLHDTLNEIEARGRDGRQRFGHAVHALGVDASRARDEAKTADAWVTGATAEIERMREAFIVLHKQVTFWEGRSAFLEPYAALAAAYRSAANSVDEWMQAKQRKQQLSQVAEQKRNEVSDLEFQILELRNALAKHEETIERQQTDCQKQSRELGERADRLETELLELATKFCSPLRARPELGPLFTQLEKTDAAA
jgi:eukaryotic-like serine/threonine-protein kinase